MSKHAKLEVSFPVELSNIPLTNSCEPFSGPLIEVMKEGQEDIVNAWIDNDAGLLVTFSSFPSRDHAIKAAKAVRSLSLEHALEFADSFRYKIDDDEMLLFNNKRDKYSFESKSVAEVLEDEVGRKALCTSVLRPCDGYGHGQQMVLSPNSSHRNGELPMNTYVCNFCGGDHGATECDEEICLCFKTNCPCTPSEAKISAIEALDYIDDEIWPLIPEKDAEALRAEFDHSLPVECYAMIVSRYPEIPSHIKALFPRAPKGDKRIWNASRKHGACYQFAFQTLFYDAGEVRQLAKAKNDEDIYLVHGFGRQQGVKVGGYVNHAWLEVGDCIVDCGTMFRRLKVSHREATYAECDVSHVVRYTKKEAMKLVSETRRHGPWEEFSANMCFDPNTSFYVKVNPENSGPPISEQTQLEVRFPLDLAKSQIMSRQFRTHVKKLMQQQGGELTRGAKQEESSYEVTGLFDDRDDAVASSAAIRRFALEHAPLDLVNSFHYQLGEWEVLQFGRRRTGNTPKIINILEQMAPPIKAFHEAS